MLRRAAAVFRQQTVPSSSRRYSSTTTTTSSTSRIARLESRLPRFLRHFTTPLRNAPISHITAFLLLHELTAIVPLIGLATAFHKYDYLPPYISEGKWVKEGTEKFGRYMKRKGWVGEENSWWGNGEGAVRVVVEVATAYAVTKALLPVRLVLSVWATPAFARWSVLPVTRWMGRFFSRSKVAKSPAAGTGAVGGGVLPRDVVK